MKARTTSVEQLPRPADEREALRVLLGARALADEEHVGVGVADAEHDLRAPGGEPAARAGAGLDGEVVERGVAHARQGYGEYRLGTRGEMPHTISYPTVPRSAAHSSAVMLSSP